jgi:hypothetical protein
MTLDPRRERLWTAMGLGPVWTLRAPPSGSVPTVEAPTGRSGSIARMGWEDLERAAAACTACGLHATRKQAVFGVGNRAAEWLLVGEAPGAEEDARGEPFVGQAGRLLDNMLDAVGLTRTGTGPRSV